MNGFFVKQANERKSERACEGESLIAKVSARKLVGNLPRGNEVRIIVEMKRLLCGNCNCPYLGNGESLEALKQ